MVAPSHRLRFDTHPAAMVPLLRQLWLSSETYVNQVSDALHGLQPMQTAKKNLRKREVSCRD